MSYDITRPQPQLFVTQDFNALTHVLKEFSQMMAYQRGGVEALGKARLAATVCTTELETGLQISGVLESFKVDQSGKPAFLKFRGPSQIGSSDRELEGHGPTYHREGYSTPLGQVLLRSGASKDPQALTDADFAAEGFVGGAHGVLQFVSGITVRGKLQPRKIAGILSFEDCTVRDDRGADLFKPEWGTYDLACGTQVLSVFGGAADRGAYVRAVGGKAPAPRPLKCNLTDANRALNELYAKVRGWRESHETSGPASLSKTDSQILAGVYAELAQKYPSDWLLRVELLELDKKLGLSAPWAVEIEKDLARISAADKTAAEMIGRGRRLLQ